MVSRQELIQQRGWTRGQVALLGRPDEVRAREMGTRRWIEHWYAPARVAAVQAGEEFQAHGHRVPVECDWGGKYGSWRAALPEASRLMLELNQAAKCVQVLPPEKAAIYGRKDLFVELLVRAGYCCSMERHVFESWQTFEYGWFQFTMLGGWHMPLERMPRWLRLLVESLPAVAWVPQERREMPDRKVMPVARRRQALALIDWVIEAAAAASDVADALVVWEPQR